MTSSFWRHKYLFLDFIGPREISHKVQHSLIPVFYGTPCTFSSLSSCTLSIWFLSSLAIEKFFSHLSQLSALSSFGCSRECATLLCSCRLLLPNIFKSHISQDLISPLWLISIWLNMMRMHIGLIWCHFF